MHAFISHTCKQKSACTHKHTHTCICVFFPLNDSLFISGFIAFSTIPKLAERIKTFYALAPVATVKYTKSLINKLKYVSPTMFKVCDALSLNIRHLIAHKFKFTEGQQNNWQTIKNGSVHQYMNLITMTFIKSPVPSVRAPFVCS